MEILSNFDFIALQESWMNEWMSACMHECMNEWAGKGLGGLLV